MDYYCITVTWGWMVGTDISVSSLELTFISRAAPKDLYLAQGAHQPKKAEEH